MSKASKDLKAIIEDKIKALADMTDQAAFSAELQDYIKFMSSFHKYSFGNVLLIYSQNSEASLVRGYKQWQGLGRQVKRGESAIKILAPIIYKRGDLKESDPRFEAGSAERIVIGFRVVNVFDISQTDGDPLPAIDWGDPESDDRLWDSLVDFSTGQGIEVKIDPDMGHGVYGSSSNEGKLIKVKRDRDISVLIHELAHSLIHWNGDRDRSAEGVKIRECEAESVAFVVGQYFGLESAGSPKYAVLYGIGADDIQASAERIRKCASKIIQGVESE